MRPHGTPQQLEARRRRAVPLLRAGKTYQSVAAHAFLNLKVQLAVRKALPQHLATLHAEVFGNLVSKGKISGT